MIVSIARCGVPALEDIDNFTAFSISAACGSDMLANALAGIGRLEANGYAWVSREWLLQNGRTQDEAWRASFDAMLSYAKYIGWIDEETDCVRAHIELAS